MGRVGRQVMREEGVVQLESGYNCSCAVLCGCVRFCAICTL